MQNGKIVKKYVNAMDNESGNEISIFIFFAISLFRHFAT